MRTINQKGEAFRLLHQREQAFIIPNPYDVGTARLLELSGFEALATTSAGYAFTVGKRDNTIERDEMLEHVRRIAVATDLPVSADLGKGFGDDPATVAETIRLTAEAGAVGGSIEDNSGNAERPLYELSQSVERIRAAAEAVRTLPFPFTLTGRAENFLVGVPDLDDVIKRLQAYQQAGADVVYAPGLVNKVDIQTVVRSVDVPVNVLMGIKGVRLTFADLSDVGVKRVSVGSGLSRCALGAFMNSVNEMKSTGTFTFADNAVSYPEMEELFGR